MVFGRRYGKVSISAVCSCRFRRKNFFESWKTWATHSEILLVERDRNAPFSEDTVLASTVQNTPVTIFHKFRKKNTFQNLCSRICWLIFTRKVLRNFKLLNLLNVHLPRSIFMSESCAQKSHILFGQMFIEAVDGLEFIVLASKTLVRPWHWAEK